MKSRRRDIQIAEDRPALKVFRPKTEVGLSHGVDEQDMASGVDG